MLYFSVQRHKRKISCINRNRQINLNIFLVRHQDFINSIQFFVNNKRKGIKVRVDVMDWNFVAVIRLVTSVILL